MMGVGADKWEIQEREAQGGDQWLKVQGVHDLICGGTPHATNYAFATADWIGGEQQIHWVHMGRLQKGCLQVETGR